MGVRDTPVPARIDPSALPTNTPFVAVDASKFEEAFGQFLVEGEVIDGLVFERARSAAQKSGERLDRVLTKLGLVPEENVAAALSGFLSIPLACAGDAPSERILPDLVETHFVRHNRLLPLALRDRVLSVGVLDPFNMEPVNALAFLSDLTIDLRIIASADFDKAFEALYGVSETDANKRREEGLEASELDVQRLRDLASEAPVIRLVNQIIASAVEARASDIHIEPGVDKVLVRYRVDGMLRTAQVLASGLRAAITSRLKIMSKLDIAERRMPQDGRIKIAVRGFDIDFRVSTIPTSFGESVVLRILDRNRVELDFAKLGFSEAHVESLNKLLSEPNGIILVTGPTGSGKTTTLYTALKALNSPDRKVFTVEDPIEYQLSGINQVQVQAEIGLNFPHALRSILRQDPDIVMIGEIRDIETARIAIQASLTGHLVLSTLHTNGAAASITRLIDIGVENYLLGSTLKGVLAQRLVRKLCPACARRHPKADFWASELERNIRGLQGHGKPDIREARGCSQCSGTGFAGRSTIAEMLLVDDDLRGLILSGKSDHEMEKAARAAGMRSMYDAGASLVWQGKTTMDEVLRATREG